MREGGDNYEEGVEVVAECVVAVDENKETKGAIVRVKKKVGERLLERPMLSSTVKRAKKQRLTAKCELDEKAVVPQPKARSIVKTTTIPKPAPTVKAATLVSNLVTPLSLTQPAVVGKRQLALPATSPLFHVDARVEVCDAGKTWWPARITQLKGGKVHVRFDGWDAKYDEWVDCESPRIRMNTRGAPTSTSLDSEERDGAEAMSVGAADVLLVGRSVKRPVNAAVCESALERQLLGEAKKPRKKQSLPRVQPPPPLSTPSTAPSSPSRAPTPGTPTSSPSSLTTISFSLRAAVNRSSREAYISRRTLTSTPHSDQDIRVLLAAGAKLEVCSGGEWYKAHVVKTRGWQVFVHYEGWDEVWDEWMDMNSSKIKLVHAAPPTIVQTVSQAVDDHEDDASDDDAWQISCNRCEKRIRQHRYFCTYCESHADRLEYQSFDLCLMCFQYDFPVEHPHPMSSFASEPILNADDSLLSKTFKGGELVSSFALDEFDERYITDESSKCISPTSSATHIKPTPTIAITPRCAFCNSEDTSDQHGLFVGPHPFKNPRPLACQRGGVEAAHSSGSSGKLGKKKAPVLWAHDACARFSPEVYVATETGMWYNVLKAWRRSRGVKCSTCKEKGATIGCFDFRCSRSYHVSCTGKPRSHFEQGVIFWCPRHEALIENIENYEDTFRCDCCNADLGRTSDDAWHTCAGCAASHFTSFDLCGACFAETGREVHEHGMESFVKTCMMERKQKREDERRLARELLEANAPRKVFGPRRNRKLEPSRLRCSYCWAESTPQWRKGYNGIPMCEDCFQLASSAMTPAPLVSPAPTASPIPDPVSSPDSPEPKLTSESPLGAVIPLVSVEPSQETEQQALVVDPLSLERVYKTDIGAYSHEWYLTRRVVEKAGQDFLSDPRNGPLQQQQQQSDRGILSSYAPADDHLFTMGFDTTYYDIPSRAPRWAAHSGGDYHGTWLPQIVRFALLRYTWEGATVLSNFSGRGTDAIECFLLKRRCCAVDINRASVALAQRNVSFSTPPELGLSAAYRPLIVRADSRNLVGSLFMTGTYDHVLSHPPYKDCIAYSAHIDGDLSRFPDMGDFQDEMAKIVAETWRLLRPGHGRCTMGIGDNRRDCFYQPVSFQTIRTYMDGGFEIEEILVKRQRYCQMAPLGTFLCTQYNFLMFTHEFIAVLRKVDKPITPPFHFIPATDADRQASTWNPITFNTITRRIPVSPIDRASIVMGTVWTFQVTQRYSLAKLAMSKLLERFGKDGMTWEETRFTAFRNEVINNATYHPMCAERDPPPTDVDDEATPPTTPPLETETRPESLAAPSEYERKRQDLVERNRKELVMRGLISELSPDGEDDAKHLDTLMSMPQLASPQRQPPWLVFIPHISVPSTAILEDGNWITRYLQFLVDRACDAADRLADGGFLIVGVKDVRVSCALEPNPADPSVHDPDNIGPTQHVPFGILLNEQLHAQIETAPRRMRLKDFVVAVPDGYSRDKDAMDAEEMRDRINEDIGDWTEENRREAQGESNVRRLLPIVQAYYFIYIKVPA
ncbi:hypothetical protein DFJ77DRAFT_170976 [Powellomyces hirtus]|nr:hypothetical protein DFJ77DRAFT_170976 [Powellomyces hirtus]